LQGILCPLETYAKPLTDLGIEVKISPFPFVPKLGHITAKSKTPLLIWPNQWKNIKGVTEFMRIVPDLPKQVAVELYSTCIRYFEMRIEAENEGPWIKAVAMDHVTGVPGKGRAQFYGNVDRPAILQAFQRAWFSVNLQGMKTRNEAYRLGSYNNTEVEALYYGCCPILHESTKQTDLPEEVYLSVASAEEIPDTVAKALKEGTATNEKRMQTARKFINGKHNAIDRYQDLRSLLWEE